MVLFLRELLRLQLAIDLRVRTSPTSHRIPELPFRSDQPNEQDRDSVSFVELSTQQAAEHQHRKHQPENK
jgi:hypothetical protein